MKFVICALSRMAAIAAVAALAACSVLPKAESPDIYRLPVTHLSPNPAKPLPWSLRIDTPQAEHMLDSPRIAVLPQGDVISVYQGARWSDRAPTLLRNRLLDAFHDDGRIAALSSDDANLQADYTLTGDLRAFQSEYRDGQPVIVIRYDARLVRTNGMRILAARSFEISEPVGNRAVPQVVSAFGKACDTLTAQIVQWTIQQRETATAEVRR
ncbi:ABC-type transport auxiliary lipoprotein family protein [Dyella tabacisoli]|uniref:ABC transporter n=1 Tax=Dyella tabacisoli TaxID=2282381 RepID=A0A369UJ54_9GAMM|nr:ABC-type transport auxiliary lipoprotein family protein [Dyella tabacisoli]RDD80571.1 ABC transporter [Dyella tabacisoli]